MDYTIHAGDMIENEYRFTIITHDYTIANGMLYVTLRTDTDTRAWAAAMIMASVWKSASVLWSSYNGEIRRETRHICNGRITREVAA